MEAVQKAKDVRWRQNTSRRKCKCAHENVIGCESPAHCAVFDCEDEGFCHECKVSFFLNTPAIRHVYGRILTVCLPLYYRVAPAERNI